MNLVVLLIAIWLSITIGTLPITFHQLWEALLHFNAQIYEHIVIHDLRIPRTIIGLGVGMSLALAGAATQGITNNPLSGPSILGVNNGAAFAIVLGYQLLSPINAFGLFLIAFVGGVVTLLIVLAIAMAGNSVVSPSKMVLAGVVVSSLLSAWTSGLLLLNQEILDQFRFWLVGSISGRNVNYFYHLLPINLISTLGLFILAPRINILNMGEERAKSIGMNSKSVRLLTSVFAVCLAASSVSIAGPIAFVGLAVPHIARKMIGTNYRQIMVLSIIQGPAFLLLADTIGRIIAVPSEVQVGIVTAMIGAPLLIMIASSRRLKFE